MSDFSNQLWILGVVLVTFGSIGNNLGTNIVSLDHQKKELKDSSTKSTIASSNHELSVNNTIHSQESSEVNYLSSDLLDDEIFNENPILRNKNTVFSESKIEKKHFCSLRTVGVTIFVIGNLMTFAAFGFAAQSLLAALESIQFVSNVVFAKYIHKEIITNRMLISTTSIIIGNVLVVIFAQHESGLFDSGAIIHMYLTNTAYQAYLVVAFVLWLIFHLTFLKYYNARVLQNTLLFKHSFIEPLAFSVSSAIIGTQAVLQAKCMSMLIQVSARGDNEFQKPTVWVLLFAWIFFVVFWLKRLDLGLKLFPPLFIIPVLQVFFIFFAILCGGIFFEEFNEFSTGQYVGFVFGVLIILTGVYGLAPVDSKPIDKNIETARASSNGNEQSLSSTNENNALEIIDIYSNPIHSATTHSHPKRRISTAIDVIYEVIPHNINHQTNA